MKSIYKRLDDLEKEIESLSITQNGEIWVHRTNEDGTFTDTLSSKFASEKPMRINILSYGRYDPINQEINSGLDKEAISI